ncbi:FAD-dependent 5-carboxymethylaminomethyl-2-thiouridine(34) oxidoreductase MnmC [Psychrosphaera ytuae]|uniref:FAD-dependent 5-carboxymethylaminomethyl-2-thiouridine(34) oxidoreductase MnmC n=1 Tax=Psychrosphaera ytuae TaxID=2820710 RepID=A0A975DBF7_9GAMM|nr:FAD-dependent 5-carboxymethylaminomethyl-2-thiouridine(34) oxidoreductase MnmC [Psychrosphaera ytuae]QTH63858.1 FAD-dependent 5-carboxymethylaminomethyl-2-thiouridine(34) oxidoreductase MnmC [Psychrosphaera ytuae]
MLNTKTPEQFFTSIEVDHTPRQIAIIGAGISGLTLASELIRKDPDTLVSIYCADHDVAQAGSSNQQGAIYPLLQAEKSVIAQFYAHAYQFACQYYRRVLPSQQQVPHQWCGVLQQAITAELDSKFDTVAELWAPLVQRCTKEESSSLAGLSLPYSSLFYPDGGWLNPQQYCFWLKKNLLASKRVRFFFDSPVVSVQPKPSSNLNLWHPVRIGAEPTRISQDCESESPKLSEHQELYHQIIICAGVDSIDFDLSNDLPITPVLGQVSKLTHDTSAAELKTVLCHKGYMTPATSQYQSFGATFEKGQATAECKTQSDQKNLEQIQKAYPDETWSQELNKANIIGANAAFRATTADHLPLAGEIIDWSWISHYVDKNNGRFKRSDKIKGELNNLWSGLFVMSGLGARGLTSAPIIAELLSSMLLNQTSELDPDIFQWVQSTVAPVRYKLREYKRTKRVPQSL